MSARQSMDMDRIQPILGDLARQYGQATGRAIVAEWGLCKAQSVIERVLDAVRDHRTGDSVPAGAVLAAIYIDPDEQVVTPEIERRAREIEALIGTAAPDKEE